ncbi:MAG TPA: hypothetical protein VNE61_02960 [Ktedonobacteraceae bacterium]|nr:hypothetical protein [Ktedonobacteraceae bacterium]
MNRKTLMIVSAVALLIAAGWGVLALTGAAAAKPQTAPPPRPHLYQGATTAYGPGVPAISPRTNAPVAYTAADVAQYIKVNGFAGGPVVSGHHLVIEKILFITSKQASLLIQGESADRPDNTIVCYVQLRGPFIPGELDVPYGVSNPNATVLRVYEIFDAHTGNMLGWGGLP